MAITQADVLAAAGSTSNATSYATASASPTADRLLTLFVAASTTGDLSTNFTITGLLEGEWEEVTELSASWNGGLRRQSVFACWSGAAPGTGTITINHTATMTAGLWYLAEWDGTDPSGAASFYGSDGPAAITAATSGAATSSGYEAAGDVPISFLHHNQNEAQTAERTEIADVGVNTPENNLAVQWYTADDTSMSWSWTSSATGQVIQAYLRQESSGSAVSIAGLGAASAAGVGAVALGASIAGLGAASTAGVGALTLDASIAGYGAAASGGIASATVTQEGGRVHLRLQLGKRRVVAPRSHGIRGST